MRFELTILGSASRAPTRERGQGGLALRWADELIVFDPGEGCQRQLLLAGLSAAQVDRICITHFHGDHCLGLSGLLQSRALAAGAPVPLHYGAEGRGFVDHLLGGSVIDADLRVEHQPMSPGQSIATSNFVLSCQALDHPTPAIGYRLDAYDTRHLVPEKLAAVGLSGRDIGALIEGGHIPGYPRLSVEDVSEVRRGPSVAIVMDTKLCEGAVALARGADLLICESTFLDADADLARSHGHLTATQAATLAADGGAGLLVLTHFSSRYPNVEAFEDEASRIFTNVTAARDLSSVAYFADAKPLRPGDDYTPVPLR